MALSAKLTAKTRTFVTENKDRITDGVAKAERAAYAKAPGRYHSQIGSTARTVVNVVEKLAIPPGGATSR